MDVEIFVLIATFSMLLTVINSSESKVKFVYKQSKSFKEELAITNVTTDENYELGRGVRKWKTMTLGDKSYGIGMTDTGIHLLITRGENYTSEYINVADDAIKILDVQLHKIWNGTSQNFEPSVLILLQGGSLSWFRTTEELILELLWTLELDKDAFQFDVYTIDKIDYLFALNRGDTEEYGITLDVYKTSVGNSRYKYLWPEQTITLEAPTTSFALNNQGPDYYLSIAQKSLHYVKIYKKVDRLFTLHWKIVDTDADTLRSISIGHKTYILTNGENSGIYRITKYGPVREALNESNVINWLPIPLMTYRDEMFLLAQKEIHHNSHTSHSIELIHSTGLDFNIYHEVPCVYYNNPLHGLDCLAEEGDHHVELNMSAVIPFENSIGLIIMNKDLQSQLFVLNVGINTIPNPKETRIKRFLQIKEKLEGMQKEIYELKVVQEKTPLLKTSKMRTKENRQRNSKVESFDDLKQKYDSIKETIEKLRRIVKESRENRGFKIKKLIVNGDVKVEGVATISNVETKKLNDEYTADIIRDIAQINDSKKIGGRKTFINLKCENVIFNTLNGIDRNMFLFHDGKSPVTLRGSVTFTKGLEVTENITTASRKVNDILLEDEVVYPGKKHDTLLMDSIKVTNNFIVKNINSVPVTENMPLSYSEETIDSYFGNTTLENLNLTNLKVHNVNSNNVTEILENIARENLNPTFSGTLEVDVLNVSEARIGVLNTLKFPDDYVLLDSNDVVNITGTKQFATDTTINSLKVDGLVNGINTSDILTLSSDQSIEGIISFKSLEVSETPEGKSPNYDILKSNDIVNHLIVEGDVIVEENIGGININSYLNNFIWNNIEDANLINSTKIFKDLSINNIDLNTINNVTVDSFVNKLENQTLNIDTLNGNVTIENLYMNGKIDDVVVRNLLEDSVKLAGDQNISSFLTFSDLKVNNLHILETLNNLAPNEFLHSDGGKHLTLEKLKNINASKVIVEGEVFGDIDGFSVDTFERILRSNGNQEISGDVHVEELYVDHLNIGKVNGYYFKELFDADHYISLMEKMILEDKVKFKNLNVLGNLTVGKINNVTMKDVVDSLTFTKENNLQPDITFRDNVIFNGVKIKNFNGIPFEVLLENLIYKNQTKVKINGTKSFFKGIEVKKYIETENLNGVLLENVLRKENDQRIRGPIVINGNVILEDDLEIHTLNDVSLKALKQLVHVSGDNIHIDGEVLFNQSVHIDDLVLQGYFNGNNLSEVLVNGIGLNDDVITKGDFTFNNEVRFKENLDISGTFNDVNLSETYDDIAFINQNDYIEGLVSFKDPVEIKGTITVESDLLANTIMGINPHDWLHKAVYINKGLIPGILTFENITVLNSISTKLLNNMNASRFVPLEIDQSIKEDLVIENAKVNQRVYVNGLVNGVDLYAEYKNTVLNQGVQNVTSKIRFNGNVVVYEDLFIKDKVNDIDFHQVVYTNENQTLHGRYNFLSETTGKNLEVYGLVNGIHFTNWHKGALKRTSKKIQEISEIVEVENLVVSGFCYGPGLISGINLKNITDDVAYKLQYKGRVENDLMTDYKAACEDVNKLLYISKKQVSKFKYLELISSVYFEKYINHMYYFNHMGEHYLLVNERNSCNTRILVWNFEEFIEIDTFMTGFLGQIIAVKSEDSRGHLITKSSNCSVHQSNLWSFQRNVVKHHQVLEDVILLQESLIPNTFYALSQNEVRQYKITSNSKAYIYRKWDVTTNSNMAFVPRGLKTGPALRDGQKIIRLEQADDAEVGFDYDIQETLMGKNAIEKNKIIPGKNGEMVVFNVGKQKKPMVAVSSREGSSIKTKSDSIKIYADVYQGALFHKIPTYKPSSITPLEFRDGETFLLFFEDQKVLQIYGYKGIEGFQYVKSAKIRGQQIIKVKLPMDYHHSKDMLIVLNNNELSLLEIVMDGNEGANVDEVYCELQK